MNSVPKLFSCSYADCWAEKSFFNQIWRINAKSYPFTHAFLGVRFKVVRESACMACKRSAVRSRYSPPKKHCTSHVKYGAFLFYLKSKLGLHCFACMPFWLFAENRDVPSDKRVCLITKETAVQQAAVPRSLLLFQLRGMAIRRSAFFTSHAPAHPQAAPKMAPPRISVG